MPLHQGFMSTQAQKRRLGHVIAHVLAGEQSEQRDEHFVVTIVGSGNSAHVCAALFEANAPDKTIIQILTRRPHIWTERPIVRFPDGGVQRGRLHKVSSDPSELVPGSDIVLWTGPVYATKEIFSMLRPHLNVRRTAVGTIFAQGLVHVLAQREFGPNARFFALRNIPWLCRCVKLGEESEIVGTKKSISVVTVNLNSAWVKSQLEPLFLVTSMGRKEPVIDMLPDFCPIVFNPANQIIHPAAYWGLFRHWQGQPLSGSDEPSEWLYRSMDEAAGKVLAELDDELQQLKDAYFAATGAEGCRCVVPLRDRLLDQYGEQMEDTSTMARMISTNQAYSMAKTPCIRTDSGVMPNPEHRVVVDDIGWGLCMLVSVAERLDTPATMMRDMIEWHQTLMGKEYLKNGRLCGRDCEELVLLKPDDPLELVAGPSDSR